MSAITLTICREVACDCLALFAVPLAACPLCAGDGTIERELDVDVEYTYHRACRGARDSLCGVRGAGAPLEPDEPESVEIESAVADDGTAIDLTEREMERAEELALEAVADMRYERYASRYDN